MADTMEMVFKENAMRIEHEIISLREAKQRSDLALSIALRHLRDIAKHKVTVENDDWAWCGFRDAIKAMGGQFEEFKLAELYDNEEGAD